MQMRMLQRNVLDLCCLPVAARAMPAVQLRRLDPSLAVGCYIPYSRDSCFSIRSNASLVKHREAFIAA